MKITLPLIIYILFFFLSPLQAITIQKSGELDHALLGEAISKGFLIEGKKKIVIKNIYSLMRLPDREKILTYLFSLGLDIDTKFFYNDHKWETMLMIATTQADIKLVSFLLHHHASTEIKDVGDDTALMYAVYRGYNDIIELLVQKGALFDTVPEDTEKFGSLPLYYCILKENVDALKIFVNHGLSSTSRIWALVFAIFLKNKEMVKVLIKDELNFNLFEYNATMDMLATILTKEEPDSKLCNKIQDILFGVGEFDLFYVLYLALLNDKEIARILLDAGANPNIIINDLTNFPLLSAVIKLDDSDAVKLLLEYGVLVNVKDSFYQAPIDYAIRQDNKEIIDLLLKNGAESCYPST